MREFDGDQRTGLFVRDQEYDRRQLHRSAKDAGLRPGNANAGITSIGGQLCVFWNPYRKLYANQWLNEPTEFIYSGEGSEGAMAETAGNRALRRVESDSTPVVVYYKLAAVGSRWLCMGEYTVLDSQPGTSADAAGQLRPDVRFHLLAVSDVPLTTPRPPAPRPNPPPLPSEHALWAQVDARQRDTAGKRLRGPANSRNKRQSDPLKSLYVLRRAIDHGGNCELCGQAPGWVGEDGLPHFQMHHLVAEVDLVDWIAALCGTCHDRMHHSADRSARVPDLRAVLKGRQLGAGRPVNDLDL